MASIWDMLFPGGAQAPQFGGQDPNAQLPVPPQQAPYFGGAANEGPEWQNMANVYQGISRMANPQAFSNAVGQMPQAGIDDRRAESIPLIDRALMATTGMSRTGLVNAVNPAWYVDHKPRAEIEADIAAEKTPLAREAGTARLDALQTAQNLAWYRSQHPELNSVTMPQQKLYDGGQDSYDLRPIPQLTAPLPRSASDRYRASQFGDETRLPEYNQTGAYGPAFGGGTGSDPRRSPYPVSGPQLMPEVTGPAVPIEDRRAEPGPPAIDQFLNATTGYDRAHWGEMLKHPMTPARDLFSGENSGGAMIHELPIPPLAREAGYDNVGRQYPGGSGALQRAPLRPEQMHALRLMGYLGADQLPIPKQQAPVF